MEAVEVHYQRLPARTNLYSLACLPGHGLMVPQMLVANQTTDNVKVFAIRLDAAEAHWHSDEVPFHYIPVEAEIIAINAFQSGMHAASSTIIVGVAIVKPAQGDSPDTFSLNVYGATTVHEPPLYNFTQLSADCQSIELLFCPFELTNAKLCVGEHTGLQNSLLLTGSDNRVHIYVEDAVNKTIQEIPSTMIFPEFESLQSRILRLIVEYGVSGHERIVAAGCQDGTVIVSYGQIKALGYPPDPSTLVTRSIQFDSPITSLSLFNQKVKPPSRMREWLVNGGVLRRGEAAKTNLLEPTELHLLVCSAGDPVHVFRDVVKQGFDKASVLVHSGDYDSVLCALPNDTNFEGNQELLVGTYGGQLLLYKQDESSGEYEVVWRRSFVHPLYAMKSIDITADGLRDLVVVSLLGVHILQHNIDKAMKTVRQALHNLLC